MSSEAEVVLSLKSHLQKNGFENQSIQSIFVDNHGSYKKEEKIRKKLEPFASIWIDGTKPDLICLLQDKVGSVIGFEVKGVGAEWKKGVSQAASYRKGVHHSILAFPYEKGMKLNQIEQQSYDLKVGCWMLEKNSWKTIVKLPAVFPDPNTLNETLKSINGIESISSFGLNHPLNYLIPVYLRKNHEYIANLLHIDSEKWFTIKNKASQRMAIKGAISLGLINAEQQLTINGMMVSDWIDYLNIDFSTINRRQRLKIVNYPLSLIIKHAFLRTEFCNQIFTCLLQNKDRLNIFDFIQNLKLYNYSLAANLFLHDPEKLEKNLEASDIKSTSVYQLKQMLWHCGILKYGASSGAGHGKFQLESDIWELDD